MAAMVTLACGLLLWWIPVPIAQCQRHQVNIPRVKLTYKDLLLSESSMVFRGNTSEHGMLLMDEERGRLFVGGRDTLFSLSLTDINNRPLSIHWPASSESKYECQLAGKDIGNECWNFIRLLQPLNNTHLYACGTGAFHPVCAAMHVGPRAGVSKARSFIMEKQSGESGRGKSPYDPKQQTTSVIVGDELYAGVASDFMGRDFAIFRTLGVRPAIRTEQHNSRWLNEPKFVAAYAIPESNSRDEDKVYFFFRETALEGEYIGKTVFSRVSQICQNDVGGHRSMINRWTTFLKARLVCSVPGSNGIDTYFDELQDVFLLQTRDPKNPVIYTIFSTSSNVFQGSAVCVYTMSDIRRVFLGPFAHKDGPNHKWTAYQGKVPYPRPGTCPSKIFGGFVWTRDFPEDVLNFVKAHPIMYQGIRPVGQRPLLMQTEPGPRYSQIVVDRVEAEDGIYDVLFIGTDVGTILKVVSVPRQSWKDLEEVLLEEIQVLKKPEPILSMEISSKLQHLYVGSANSVTQLSLHRCTIYGKACVDCCLARDPYCAWDGKQCSRYFPSTRRRLRRQDVRNGDPLSQCSDQYFSMGTEMDNVEERLLYGVGNSTLLLECVPRSLQAHVAWMFSQPNDENREEVKTDDRVVVTPQGLLLRSVVRNDAGLYACRTTEHSFVQTLARFRLEVIGPEQLDILLRQRATGEEDNVDDQDDKDGGQTEKRGDLAILDKDSSSPRVWYREFLRLVNHPSLSGGVAEICERARLSKKQRPHRRRKARGRGAQKLGRGNLLKWKHAHEARKRRNRRTHNGNTRPPRSIDA